MTVAPSPSALSHEGEGDRLRILDVPIERAMRKEIMARVRAFFAETRVHMIATVNPEMLVAAHRDRELWEILQKTDLNVADGIGVALVARWLAQHDPHPRPSPSSRSLEGEGSVDGPLTPGPLPAQVRGWPMERFPGVDLMTEICRMCAKDGRSVYLVGGREGAAERAAEVLKQKFPGLRVVGAEQGPVLSDPHPDPLHVRGAHRARGANFPPLLAESPRQGEGGGEGSVVLRIIAAKPDALFVAFGHGKQEKWIHHNFRFKILDLRFLRFHESEYPISNIQYPRICMGVGGAFDMLAGITPRAPLLMRKMGVEWLWRLILEPRRIRRILTAVVVFCIFCLREKFEARISTQSSDGSPHRMIGAKSETNSDAQNSKI